MQLLRASNAKNWTRCAARQKRIEKGLLDGLFLERVSGDSAKWGTAAHFLRAECFRKNVEPEEFLGKTYCNFGDSETLSDDLEDLAAAYFRVDITQEMCDLISRSLNFLKENAQHWRVFVEEQLNISSITGEENATGTADAVIITDDRLIIEDLKTGWEYVTPADEQLLIYARAALDKFDPFGTLKEVVLTVSQPRLDRFDFVEMPVKEFDKKIEEISKKAIRILTTDIENLKATPGEIQCKYCEFAAHCSELQNEVSEKLFDENLENADKNFIVGPSDIVEILAQAYSTNAKKIEVLENGFYKLDKISALENLNFLTEKVTTLEDEKLAGVLESADMIKTYLTSVESEVFKRLKESTFTDPRFKLVKGRSGNKTFTNEDDVVKLCEKENIKNIFDQKLLGPAKIEKLFKDANTTTDELKKLITQKEGGPTIAKMTDSRPNYVFTSEADFEIFN